MGLTCGIIGLPNAGKSTVFNALTGSKAAVDCYPFTTIDPNQGAVSVPDQRLRAIAEVAGPERAVPATIQFVDIAGLVRGASRGEGLGNKFLGHIREVDAVAHVVRCFDAPNVPHVDGQVDPVRDAITINMELCLADLEALGRRRERVLGQSKGRGRNALAELDWIDCLERHLDQGVPLRCARLEPAAAGLARELFLVSAKPMIYVANLAEDAVASPCDDPGFTELVTHAESEAAAVVPLAARLECELLDLDPDDRKEFMAAAGIAETGLARLIKTAYSTLGLVTYFTVNRKEVRARTLRSGSTAVEAAAQVHTDMARGFIRAEVIAVSDLLQAGSFAAARDMGLVRVEGRDYVVRDGEVLYFRFSV